MQGLYITNPTQETRATVDDAHYTAPTRQHELIIDRTDEEHICRERAIDDEVGLDDWSQCEALALESEVLSILSFNLSIAANVGSCEQCNVAVVIFFVVCL